MNSRANYPVVAVPRNCHRCGSEFGAVDRQIVCPACKKPKVKGRKPRVDRPLSLREKQLVKLVADAKSNKEIAYELHLTEGTVKEYLQRVFKKTGTRGRTALAVWFWKGGGGEQ